MRATALSLFQWHCIVLRYRCTLGYRSHSAMVLWTGGVVTLLVSLRVEGPVLRRLDLQDFKKKEADASFLPHRPL